MSSEADVVIIGSGIAGAAVYRSLRSKRPRLLVLEAGPALTPRTAHFRNLLPYNDSLWRTLVSAAARPPVHTGNPPLGDLPPAGTWDRVRPDQRAEEALPGLLSCCAVGGNGLIWSGIVLPPAPLSDGDLTEAEFQRSASWLGAQIVAGSPRQDWLQEAHGLTPVPLAWSPKNGWHGPRPLAGAGFRPEALHSARRIVFKQGHALGVEVCRGSTTNTEFIPARHIIVAAGVVGTVRLLWASGLEQDLPGLGQGIVHHPVAVAQVAMPGAVWSRMADNPRLTWPAAARVFPAPRGGHTLVIAESAWIPDNRVDTRATFSVYAYATLDDGASRRLSFVPEQSGPDGLPLPRFIAPRSPAEAEYEDRALAEARAWASKLGTILPSGRPRVLPRGADQHLAGGARIGNPNDPLAVAESSGRLRCLDNVWIAGAAALPSAVSTHPAQTIVALAARVGRAVRALLIDE